MLVTVAVVNSKLCEEMSQERNGKGLKVTTSTKVGEVTFCFAKIHKTKPNQIETINLPVT